MGEQATLCADGVPTMVGGQHYAQTVYQPWWREALCA